MAATRKGRTVKSKLIAFTDADNNTILVRFEQNRIHLCGIDSHPVLEGEELKRFVVELLRICAPDHHL